MEGFIALASFSLAYAFIVLLGLILLLNILGLPANWVVVLLVVLWKFLHPAEKEGNIPHLSSGLMREEPS